MYAYFLWLSVKKKQRDEQIVDAPRQVNELLHRLSREYETDESISLEEFVWGLETRWNDMKGSNPYNWITVPYYSYLYSLVRKVKPEVAVETGVFLGCSSYIILAAMEQNGRGRLISNDITSKLFGRFSTGFVVPQSLRHRWMFAVEDSRTFLPSMLREQGSIDLFLSDSFHAYSVMRFEMETAWPYLREGGVMLVDDCNQNLALYDFAKGNQVKPFLLSRDGFQPESWAIVVK